MKLLFANPNTSEQITERIRTVAEAAAAPGTKIVAVTAKAGVQYIATRAEAVIGATSALELLAEHSSGCDAAVIAAFGDPGLGGARELTTIPVIGLAEAGLMAAQMLGRRYSIVSFSSKLGPWYRECVEYHGLLGRLVSIRLLETPFNDVTAVQSEKESLLVGLCEAAAGDGADVVVLAGAPLAGLAQKIADRLSIPVIDCVHAAVHLAEALARMKVKLKRIPPKVPVNLSPALTNFFRGDGST
jgi:Asp/Glu/hydantoin racemase